METKEEVKEGEVEEEKTEEVSEETVEEVKEEEVEEEVVERRGKKRGPKKIPEYILEKEITTGEEERYIAAERIMTIRFYPKLKSAPKWKRAKKAAKLLREFVDKYVKYASHPETKEKIRLDRKYIWIHPKVNEQIWSRGAKNPPRKIRVRVVVRLLEPERREGKIEAELRVLPLSV